MQAPGLGVPLRSYAMTLLDCSGCLCGCRLDQAFIFIVSVLIAFGLSWNVYGSWVGIAINTGVAAAVAALGVREVRSLQPHFQRHRWAAILSHHALARHQHVCSCLLEQGQAQHHTAALRAHGSLEQLLGAETVHTSSFVACVLHKHVYAFCYCCFSAAGVRW